MTMVWRFLLSILFLLLAAPVHYHFHWIDDLVNSEMGMGVAMRQALSTGALYFYSFILAIESIMRLVEQPSILEARLSAKILMLLAVVALLPFVPFLMHGLKKELPPWMIEMQVWNAAYCLIISIVTHLLTHMYAHKNYQNRVMLRVHR